jgi:hypothetical protein
VTAANSTATKNPFNAIRIAIVTKFQNNESLLLQKDNYKGAMCETAKHVYILLLA